MSESGPADLIGAVSAATPAQIHLGLSRGQIAALKKHGNGEIVWYNQVLANGYGRRDPEILGLIGGDVYFYHDKALDDR